MGVLTKFESRWQRWALTACILLLLLAVGAQAIHVHLHESSAPCLACVSAHSNSPVASVVTTVLLISISAVLLQSETVAPSFESILPLFIRPPPSR